MSDFAPPTGPPPPKVPEGWKAVWNDQYKEWFYVNLHTKQSTWEKPTEPAPNPNSSHDAAPPSYASGPTAPQVSDTKKPLDSNNPYNHNTNTETDEQLARRLQAEEDARVRGSNSHSPLPGNQDRGASDTYYNTGSSAQNYPQQQGPGMQGGYPQSSSSPYPQQGQPQSSSDKGLFGKLKSKLGGGGMGGSRPPQGYGMGGGYPQQAPYGGGYPPQGPGYGGYGGGYPPQQQMYAQQPPRKSGLGAGGAAALGVGGGLVGGMLLADAFEDHDEHEYQEGYQDGQDQGGYDDGGGGDFGGGDF